MRSSSTLSTLPVPGGAEARPTPLGQWLAALHRRYATGSWLTPGLVRFAAILSLLGTVAQIVLLLLSADGTLDFMGRPLGTDFTSFWSAGAFARDGTPVLAYDWDRLWDAQARLHGTEHFFPFSYPPVFLLIAAPLAALPYLPALVLWQGATLVALLLVLGRALPRPATVLVAASSPLVFLCLGHGQTAFLTAALFTGGVVALGRGREVLAGLCFGALVYKPQFGILLPLFLMAAGYRRAFAAAAATVLALVGATLLLWGPSVWVAFLEAAGRAQAYVLEAGGGGLEKFQSVFSWVRLGFSREAAYAAQGVVGAAAIVGTLVVARRPVDARLKGAAAMVAALLATPYMLDYDLVLLGAAAVLVVASRGERRPLPWETTLLAAVWLLPALSRTTLSLVPVPLGLLTVLAVALVIAERARPGPAEAPVRAA